MKRKIKIKKLGKLIITGGFMCMMPYVYKLLVYLGEFAMTSTLAELLVIIGWLMIVFGVFFLTIMWED